MQSLETESSVLDGRFSPLKPASIDQTGALTKSGEIRIFRRVFGQNTLDFYEILVKFWEMSPNLVRSQPGLVEISPDLAHFGLKSTILAGFSTMDDFNRTDCVSGTKPIAPIRLSRRWVRTFSTRVWREGLGLGTSPTRIDSWTPLGVGHKNLNKVLMSHVIPMTKESIITPRRSHAWIVRPCQWHVTRGGYTVEKEFRGS